MGGQGLFDRDVERSAGEPPEADGILGLAVVGKGPVCGDPAGPRIDQWPDHLTAVWIDRHDNAVPVWQPEGTRRRQKETCSESGHSCDG